MGLPPQHQQSFQTGFGSGATSTGLGSAGVNTNTNANNNNSSSQPQDNNTSGTSGFGNTNINNTVPTEITDISNEKWTRSSEPIGSGGFSEVYLGLGGHGMLVAMKFFLLESAKSSIAELKNEVTLLSKLSHENIVSYVSCAFTSSHFIIIMEYVSGGSLDSLRRQFGPLPLQALKKYLFDILRGLQYLHSKGSVHCDVKPHNALLHNDGVVKLTDFGSTVNQIQGNNLTMTTLDAQKLKHLNGGGGGIDDEPSYGVAHDDGGDGLVVRGTPHYMAPEAARNKICPASDIWSVGISVMELYTGKLPWSDKYMKMSPQNFVLALSSDEPPTPTIPDDIDENVKDFVLRCLVVDPKTRSTIEELLVSPLLAV